MSQGHWNVAKLGRLFMSEKAIEERAAVLNDAIERGRIMRSAVEQPQFKNTIAPLLLRVRREAERRLMEERDDQERLKLIGRMAAIDDVFTAIGEIIKSGETAYLKMEKLKGK